MSLQNKIKRPAQMAGRFALATKPEISGAGGAAIAVQTDVTDRTQVQGLVDAAIAQYGRIDVMINNAGLIANAPLDALKVDEWDAMIDINLKGVLYGIAALPVFRKQDTGHFINLASVGGIKVAGAAGLAMMPRTIVAQNAPPSFAVGSQIPARSRVYRTDCRYRSANEPFQGRRYCGRRDDGRQLRSARECRRCARDESAS